MEHTDAELQAYINNRAPIDAEAKEKTRPLFEMGGFAHASLTPMIAFDRHGNILWRNATYAEWVVEDGNSMEDLSLFDFLRERNAVEVARLLLQVFDTGQALQCVLRIRMLEGNYNHAEWILNPLFNAKGEVVALVSTGRDVADQMRVERERLILYNIAEAINQQGSLYDVLYMVRGAIIEIGEFDRAGVWLLEGQELVGAWGTEIGRAHV